jgi:hypothetical protein
MQQHFNSPRFHGFEKTQPQASPHLHKTIA